MGNDISYEDALRFSMEYQEQANRIYEMRQREFEEERIEKLVQEGVEKYWRDVDKQLKIIATVRNTHSVDYRPLRDMIEIFKQIYLPSDWEIIQMMDRNNDTCRYVIGPKKESV